VSIPGSSAANIAADLVRELRLMSTLSTLFGEACADRLNLPHSDMETLDLLNIFGPMSPGRLSELTGLSSGATSRLIDRLETAGFACRKPDPSDRRKVIVEPVPAEKLGQAMALYAPMARRHLEMWAGFKPEDLQTVLDFVRKSNEIMLEENARIRRETRECASGESPESP
jgi:DNA-binding MarR family transcriptional regulator